MKEIIEIPDQITDEFIISALINEKGRIYNSYLLKNEIIKSYLETRFPDSLSVKETIKRIQFVIEVRPVCPICGRPVRFTGRPANNGFEKTCGDKTCIYELGKQTRESFYMTNYGVKSNMNLKTFREKTKQTWMEHYGFDNPNKSEDVKNKIKLSWSNKTEEELKEIKEKTEATFMEKYGATNVYASEYGKKKCKEAWLKKYGVENPSLAEEIVKKRQQTLRTMEVQEKINETKKRNGSAKSSAVEKKFLDYLEDHFHNDFESQYRSELYPFNCDFYIKSLDLYIEIQGTWKHGGKPYDGTDEDLKILNFWEERQKQLNSQNYKHAIKVWTISDVKKRETAKRNNLNYLEIFSCKIEEVIEQFEKYLEER